MGPGPDEKGLGRKHILCEIERSLKRLRTDFLDIYYLHRPDLATPVTESLAVFLELIRSGKVRHWGFSNYDAAQTAEMLEAGDALGMPRPVVNQPPYSLLKRDIEKDVLPLCRRDGIGVVPYQVLQGGLLTGKYRLGQAPPPGSRMAEKKDWLMNLTDDVYDQLEKIEQEAKSRGLSMTQYAISWALTQPGITSVIIGVKRTEQLAEAIAAAK
jgi:aryl-alcohol dehydrogenase-like predicted oxidoreductase